MAIPGGRARRTQGMRRRRPPHRGPRPILQFSNVETQRTRTNTGRRIMSRRIMTGFRAGVRGSLLGRGSRGA